jgi:hypothetical protein
MIQISNEDALFILDELNKRAEHQMAAYNGIDPDLQGVINDLDAQLNATLPAQETPQEAPTETVAAFMDSVLADDSAAPIATADVASLTTADIAALSTTDVASLTTTNA